MTDSRAEVRLPIMSPAELAACVPTRLDDGLGALRTDMGNLPLRALEVRARIVGLTSRVHLTQRFTNPHAEPLEATYVFPLPDRGAVTALRLTAGDRTVVASLRERSQARREYDDGVAAGRRAAIAEEERPDVFTLRVGNVLPREEVTVELTVVGVLPVADGAATFRFPLVVAPRYIPGSPLAGDAAGEGWHPDTDAVPDASRITPPVLLPGFPFPVRLDVEVEIDPAGLTMGTPRSSLYAVRMEGGRVRFEPGQHADRDIVLRIPLGSANRPDAALTLVPDALDQTAGGHGSGEGTGQRTEGTERTERTEGTFELTVLPPDLAAVRHPRDVVLLLDRSGSMAGWKIVAARRAASRIVDTLTEHDRFAVLAFDDRVETPAGLGENLMVGSDRHRFRAVEFLARLDARGGTELAEPLGRGLALLADRSAAEPSRDRVVVVVTDGQVGNEDEILRAHAAAVSRVRLHTVGIDQAVNAGFLGRLASLGGGRCELVESEDRLDEAMANIHRRIGSPLVTGIALDSSGLDLDATSLSPARLPDLFAGVPYVVRGRYRAAADAAMTMRGVTATGETFTVHAEGRTVHEPAIAATWARARLRDLEDHYAATAQSHFGLEEPPGLDALERRIVETSLRFGVLCRFTAFVAVDERVVTDGSAPRSIMQPVPLPSGWEMPPPPQGSAPHFAMTAMAASAPVRPSRGLGGGRRMSFARMASSAGGRPVGAARAGLAPRHDAPGPDDAAFLRELLAGEARRLRARAGEPDHRRREALLDLGSRLVVLAEGSTDARWRELLDLLRPERVAAEPLAQLWEAVLARLDALATAGRG